MKILLRSLEIVLLVLIWLSLSVLAATLAEKQVSQNSGVAEAVSKPESNLRLARGVR